MKRSTFLNFAALIALLRQTTSTQLLKLAWLIIFLTEVNIFGQTTQFTDIFASLKGVYYSSIAWGDYDNDSDLDILLTGRDPNFNNVSQIYRNDSGNFVDINAGLTGVSLGSVAWGDYDNDGDLDILLTGWLSGLRISKVYRNDNGKFVDINAGLTQVYQSSAAWGDYDNDGDLDILLTGDTYFSTFFSKVYRNDGGNFVDIEANLTGVYDGSTAWGDYDNDGDLDILLTGSGNSKIYRNDDGKFVNINAGLTGLGVVRSSAAWGDYDNDGDLDILLTGWNSNAKEVSKVYRNDSGNFVDIQINLIGVGNSSVAWGDYDNDGDLDILLTGEDSNFNKSSKVYRNDNGNFVDINAGLTNVSEGSVAWGDYDNDGDLDILLTGQDANRDLISKVFRNNNPKANSIPTAPTNLFSSVSGNSVTLSWNKSIDSETKSNALTYNLRVATTAGGTQTVSPMANVLTGYRKAPKLGNTNHRNSWTIKKLSKGKYYWSLQAIDNTFAGSVFSPEQSFSIATPSSPKNLRADAGFEKVTLSWDKVDEVNFLRYRIYGGPSPRPTTVVDSTDNVNDAIKTIMKLTNGITYYFRVTMINSSYEESDYSDEVNTTPALFTDISAPLVGISDASIAWGDYDNDDDLDILLMGSGVSKIYRNNAGKFEDIEANLTGVDDGSAAWGDYDNDGDLDILLTGDQNSSTLDGEIQKVYRNENGNFVDINANLIAVRSSSAAWGDYDNDGDLDILLTGAGISKVYRNNRGNFEDIKAALTGISGGSVAWGDYDNDGDLDILLAGSGYSRIYRNDAGDFVDIKAGLQGAYGSSTAWGDYDNDGDLDILLAGSNVSKVYRNDERNFVDIEAKLASVEDGSVVWGDYDNDGDLDILLTGRICFIESKNKWVSKVYSNNGGSFVEINVGLPEFENPNCYVTGSIVAWGDYDKDGDLDILRVSIGVSKIYRNNFETVKVIPTPPANLTSTVSGNSVTLSWANSTSSQITQSTLTYNIRMGTNSGGVQKVSPMTDVITGYRKVPQLGNTYHRKSWTIKNLPRGTYYWSVQAVNHAFLGSEFAAEQSFATITLAAPQNLAATAGNGQVLLQWSKNTDAGFFYYRIYSDKFPDPTVLIDSTRNSGDTTKVIRGLTNGQLYYFRITAIDANGNESAYSNAVSAMPNTVALFTEFSHNLQQISYGNGGWGDYDNDGDLDILLGARLYQNDKDRFSETNTDLFGTGATAWGDYDNDGDLDILSVGSADLFRSAPTIIYRNNAGRFEDSGSLLPGLNSAAAAWGDYDNDGDLDILLTGDRAPFDSRATIPISTIYRNDNGSFVNAQASLAEVFNGAVAWGDYDNDGDLDILLTGIIAFDVFSRTVVSKIYRNDKTAFADIRASLPGVSSSAVAWADYDSDGDLDILLTGFSDDGPISKIFKNDNGNFLDIKASLIRVSSNSVAWGDYDNDGDLDVLLAGHTGSEYVSKIYRNDNGNFVDIGFSLPADVIIYFVAWGDYNNDKNLDILLSGRLDSSPFTSILKIYRNNIVAANTSPDPPTELAYFTSGDSVILNWKKAKDNKTAQEALTYNIRIGSKPGKLDIVSPMSILNTGFRQVPKFGNAGHTNKWTIRRNLPEGKYYWSVQAIDNAYAGSQFAPEQSFVVGQPPSVVLIPPLSPNVGQPVLIAANVTDRSGVAKVALNYRKGGSSSFTSASISQTGSIYQAIIPEDAITSRGIEYFIEATDSVGNTSRTPQSGVFSIQVKIPKPGLTKESAQPHGSEQNAYRLCSVPLDLDNKDARAVLEDDLGQYRKSRWRFYALQADQSYTELPDISPIMAPGKAFWLIVKDPSKIISTGAGKSNRSDSVFVIPLHARWNFVANPYNFSIPLSNVTLKNGNTLRVLDSLKIRSYLGHWNDAANDNEKITELKPFEGYAVFSDSSGTLLINPDLSNLTGPFTKTSIATNNGKVSWSIHILAQCQEARDEDNVAAIVSSASDTRDDLDQPEPPVIGEYVSAYFPHREWNTLAKTYCIDARPVPTDGEVWEFEVKTNIRDKVNLTFEGIDEVPNEFEVWLVDDALKITQNLRETNHYAVAGSEQPKQLKLVVGKHDFVGEKLAGAQLIPTSYELSQNFPNPFNPATTIRYGLPQAKRVTLKIYNLLGEEVALIMNDELRAAGYHAAIWDGRDKNDRVVASGVYVYRMQAGSFVITKKLALIK